MDPGGAAEGTRISATSIRPCLRRGPGGSARSSSVR